MMLFRYYCASASTMTAGSLVMTFFLSHFKMKRIMTRGKIEPKMEPPANAYALIYTVDVPRIKPAMGAPTSPVGPYAVSVSPRALGWSFVLKKILEN